MSGLLKNSLASSAGKEEELEAKQEEAYEMERQKKRRLHEEQAQGREVEEFLRCVAYGEQDRAEEMLIKDKNLVLKKGRVTDLSHREFKEITGFQYALWALDWHMWTMLLKYLPKEAAVIQCTEVEEKGVEYKIKMKEKSWHGWVEEEEKEKTIIEKQASWQRLIDTYAIFSGYRLIHYIATYWIEQIGGAQLLLPVHVVNEYCHGSRAFYPLPDFRSGVKLTRSRMSGGVDWYDVRCSQEWAHYRSDHDAAYHATFVHDNISDPDKVAITSLLKIRQQQLENLRYKLSYFREISHLLKNYFPLVLTDVIVKYLHFSDAILSVSKSENQVQKRSVEGCQIS